MKLVRTRGEIYNLCTGRKLDVCCEKHSVSSQTAAKQNIKPDSGRRVQPNGALKGDRGRPTRAPAFLTASSIAAVGQAVGQH